MRLYDAGGKELMNDDDSGVDLYSQLDIPCSNALSAGTYRVEVTEYGNNGAINAYFMNLLVWGCGM